MIGFLHLTLFAANLSARDCFGYETVSLPLPGVYLDALFLGGDGMIAKAVQFSRKPFTFVLL